MVRVKFDVDMAKYSADLTHNLTVSTTEYVCLERVLAHMVLCDKSAPIVSDEVRALLPTEATPTEMFMQRCKTSADARPTSISKEEFSRQLSHFDKAKTVVQTETVEKYDYLPDDGIAREVHIFIKKTASSMQVVPPPTVTSYAEITFTSVEERAVFVTPEWLSECSAE